MNPEPTNNLPTQNRASKEERSPRALTGSANHGQEPRAERTKDAARSGVGGVIDRVLAQWPSQWKVTRAQVEAFARLIGPGGTITGDKYDDLMLVCVAYSRACGQQECCEWLPFDLMPDWESAVWAEIYAGGGGAEQEANNGTRETKSGAGSQSDGAVRQSPAPKTP